ncbi:MAG TPA: aminotransferase class IV [Mycobacteriales bacterium]|jgi:4-amino-4-deoxychorismate lyase|nr:aminotransferase class IV [Mycobacteriales bacterium]
MATLAVLRPDGPQLVPAAEPVIRAEDVSLLRGEGVFETTSVFGGEPVELQAHLTRLARSAAAIGLPLPPTADFAATARLAVADWPEPDGVLRLVATKGGDGVEPVRFALVTPYPTTVAAQRRAGLRAITLSFGIPAALRSAAAWLLGGVKSTSYAVPMAGQRAAVDAGADDCIWVSSDDEVLEASTSSVLVSTGGQLVTPPPADLGLLPSLTLARLRLLTEIVERRVSRAELLAADEILLASSVRGVVPVAVLDGVPRPLGARGRRLPDELDRALRAAPAVLGDGTS